jgi:hypothetical protein
VSEPPLITRACYSSVVFNVEGGAACDYFGLLLAPFRPNFSLLFVPFGALVYRDLSSDFPWPSITGRSSLKPLFSGISDNFGVPMTLSVESSKVHFYEECTFVILGPNEIGT